MRSFLVDPRKLVVPTAETALPGRSDRMPVPDRHFVSDAPLEPPFPPETDRLIVGMGCFWGAEQAFWQTPGVYTTAVGYAGGTTPNPTYQEVCTGKTGHTEVVLVIFTPAAVSYEQLLKVFWEGHDPTQGMRQGNDVGTQYRSAIFYDTELQRETAQGSRGCYQSVLSDAGFEPISTEILPAGEFYYAEGHHQQYLAKNPGGYCGHGGTGLSCPVGLKEAR